MGARVWAELRGRVRWSRVVLEPIAVKKGDVVDRGRSMPRARFWTELREGRRAAEAHAAATWP
jgi:hypothetical protein